MADSCRVVLHFLRQQWICHRQYRGESGHPVSQRISALEIFSNSIGISADTSMRRTASESMYLYHTRRGNNHRCSDNFSFKCHRRDSSPNNKDQALVYAVNDISFHPVHGTFSTCGQSLNHRASTPSSTCIQDRMVSSISGTRMHVQD